MRITVCDDCHEDVLSLKKYLTGHNVSVYSDADSLIADMKNKNTRYDLYLLDIYIEGSMDGIGLAKAIREIQEESVICFVSTSDAFYREAYDLYAIQYLIKPVREQAVKQLLGRVSQKLDKYRERNLSFQFRGQTKSIPYSKVLYISSREHTLSICCTDGTVQEYKGKLNELASQVCGDTFMRCHQSFVVNMYHVDSLSGTDLTLSGVLIPVSRRYFAEVKKRYQEILFEEVD